MWTVSSTLNCDSAPQYLLTLSFTVSVRCLSVAGRLTPAGDAIH